MADAAAEPSAGSAADHLAAAWHAAHGRAPDPGRAYSEAIKAVESAAQSTLQPNHANAPLGSMLGKIGNARHKFDTVLVTRPDKDALALVEEPMRPLWQGQTARHGSQEEGTVVETREAARAALHLAACSCSGSSREP